MTEADDAAHQAAKDIAAGRWEEPEGDDETVTHTAFSIPLSQAPPEVREALRAAGVPIPGDEDDLEPDGPDPVLEELRRGLVERHRAQIARPFTGTAEDALDRATLYAELMELFGGSPHIIASMSQQSLAWAAVADGIDIQDMTVTEGAAQLAMGVRDAMEAEGTLTTVLDFLGRLAATDWFDLDTIAIGCHAALRLRPDHERLAGAMDLSEAMADIWREAMKRGDSADG